MRLVMLGVMALMLFKDFSFNYYALGFRGIAQALCLIVGLSWVLANFSSSILKRYGWVWLYLASLSMSTLFSSDIGFVAIQLISLASILLFFIAYHEIGHITSRNHPGRLNQALIWLFGLVTVVSLGLLAIKPALVYGSGLYAGDRIGMEYRFTGFFVKPAGMATVAGVLAGLALLGLETKTIKFGLLGVALFALALTQSRTFWVAFLVAGLITLLTFNRKYLIKTIIWGTFLCLIAAPLILYKIDDVGDIARFSRADTVTTLSGRTGLWKMAYQALANRPWIGYGLTLGAQGLYPQETVEILGQVEKSSREIARQTMHNGYLQSLMDGGIMGTLAYLGIIYTGLKRLRRARIIKAVTPCYFMVLFFAVANLGENVIYSASTIFSVVFWAYAMYALSLGGRSITKIDAAYPSLSAHGATKA